MMIMVSVEESSFLVAVDRVVGGSASHRGSGDTALVALTDRLASPGPGCSVGFGSENRTHADAAGTETPGEAAGLGSSADDGETHAGTDVSDRGT
jgi:hypothetical protein